MNHSPSGRTPRPGITGLRAGIAAFATVLLMSAGAFGAHAVWTAATTKTATVTTAKISATLTGTTPNLDVAYDAGITEVGASTLRTKTGPIVASNTGETPSTLR